MPRTCVCPGCVYADFYLCAQCVRPCVCVCFSLMALSKQTCREATSFLQTYLPWGVNRDRERHVTYLSSQCKHYCDKQHAADKRHYSSAEGFIIPHRTSFSTEHCCMEHFSYQKTLWKLIILRGKYRWARLVCVSVVLSRWVSMTSREVADCVIRRLPSESGGNGSFLKKVCLNFQKKISFLNIPLLYCLFSLTYPYGNIDI